MNATMCFALVITLRLFGNLCYQDLYRDSRVYLSNKETREVE